MKHPSDDDHRLDGLIGQWLDDDLGPAESAELEAALVESPAARARFWEVVTFESLIHEAVGLADISAAAGPSHDGPRRIRMPRIAAIILASLSLLVIGGGLGAILTTQALAGLARSIAARFTLLDEGFESGSAPTSGHVPSVPDVWSGDPSAVVGSRQGVMPSAGARMLEFLKPYGDEEGERVTVAAEIWRILTVAEVRGQLARLGHDFRPGQDRIRIDCGAAFNQREEGTAGSTDQGATERASVAGIGVFAFRGPVSEAAALWNDRMGRALASGQNEQQLDGDPTQWQRLDVTMAIPAETDFLLVVCFVRDKNRRPRSDFDGQFIDDVHISASLEPVPRGGSL